jgi:hypothetical protein
MLSSPVAVKRAAIGARSQSAMIANPFRFFECRGGAIGSGSSGAMEGGKDSGRPPSCYLPVVSCHQAPEGARPPIAFKLVVAFGSIVYSSRRK